MNQPKYKIGDKVWTIRLEKAKKFTIAYIDQEHYIKHYTSKPPEEREVHKYYLEGVDRNVRYYYDHELFPTKEALIASL